MSLLWDSEYSLESVLSLHLSFEFEKTSDRRFSFTPQSEIKQLSFELFHEQLPLPVPCYDLLPITELAVGRARRTSGTPGSLELTGGEYKT